MGAFFDSVHVLSESTIDVQEYIEHNIGQYGCYIAPPINGWTTIFLMSNDSKLCCDMSKQLKTFVFEINLHDDDIFYYSCYHSGNEIDVFDSAPGSLSDDDISVSEKQRLKGNPQKWVNLLPFHVDAQRINDVLEEMRVSDMMLGLLPEEFCSLLHLPNALTSYEYIASNDPEFLKVIAQLDKFIHIPFNPDRLTPEVIPLRVVYDP
jgi:hypothetical protein